MTAVQSSAGVPTDDRLLAGSPCIDDLPWREWVAKHFPFVCDKPFGVRHERLWEWFESLQEGEQPPPRVEVWPRGGAKALAVNTPIPTPNGWVTMGDVGVGDLVLDHRGRPTRVVDASAVSVQRSYKVRFDDGSEIIAAHDHLWSVLDRGARHTLPIDVDWATDTWDATDNRPLCEVAGCERKTRKGILCTAHAERRRTGRPDQVRYRATKAQGSPRSASTLTTEQLLAVGLRFGPERRFAIPTALSFAGSDRALPVPPYVLGAWLGDGTSSQSAITAGAQDADEIQRNLEAGGATVRRHPRPNGVSNLSMVDGMRAALRDAGVLGNKHIPAIYLRASEAQRLDLLRGLLDTDGTVSSHSSSADFVSTRKPLAAGVQELACSLGYRVTVSEERARLRGRDCGPLWRLRIAGAGPEVFGLSRKRQTLIDRSLKAARNTGRLRYIESIEQVGEQPVRCIVVDSPGHLFLAGDSWIPTHNSTSAELGVARLAVKLTRRYVLICSETQDQADKHVQAIATLLEKLGVARSVNVYGLSKGWKRNELRTANGFNVSAFGLDTAARGVKLDEFRPDAVVFDDIDSQSDTEKTIEKKIAAITTAIVPAGSSDCAYLWLQNLIHEEGVFARLVDGRADFMHTREPAYVEPAVIGLQYEAQDRGDGLKTYRITGGVPTWAGQSLAICEKQINEWGLRAFLREAQHEVAGAAGWFFDVSKLQPLTREQFEEWRAVRTCRAWDLAATQDGGDWTVGGKLAMVGRYPDVMCCITDAERGQWASNIVRDKVRDVAWADGLGVTVRLPQDPAQAGKAQADQFRKLFKDDLPGFTLKALPITGKKGTRARGLAEAVNKGNVYYLLNADGSQPTWFHPVKECLRKFKDDLEERQDQQDDDVDAFADAFNELAGNRKWGFS